MNWIRIGQSMSVIAFILIVLTLILTKAATGLGLGSLGFAFFLYAVGLNFVVYGESTKHQRQSHTNVVDKLGSLERELVGMRQQLSDIEGKMDKGEG